MTPSYGQILKTVGISIFLGFMSDNNRLNIFLLILFWFCFLYFLFHYVTKKIRLLDIEYTEGETIVVKCGGLFLFFYIVKCLQFGNYDVLSLFLTAYCFVGIFYVFSRIYRGEIILQKTITESDTLSAINKFVTSLKNLFQ